MSATHFLMNTPQDRERDGAVSFAYNLPRVMNVVGVKLPIAAIRYECRSPVSAYQNP